MLLPGVGVVGLEGGADGFSAGLFTAFFSASIAEGVGVGVLLPGFDTTKVTRPSVRFSKFAACKISIKLKI